MHGTPAKNKRGDLPTILITPEERGFDPQSLAMTRSIGDLYMQSFGVTWEPEVITLTLTLTLTPTPILNSNPNPNPYSYP